MVDLTIIEALGVYLLDETVANFVELIHASNIPLKAWIMGIVTFILIPVIGILLYKALRSSPVVILLL